MTPAVRIDELTREFRGGKRALRRVRLSVREGERVAIMGPNGSGKSTLLNILSTTLAPSSGDAVVLGHSVARAPSLARREAGWVQAIDEGFVPAFTGLENLEYFAALRGPRGARDAAIAEVARLFADFGPFREALSTPFHACSSGMRQLLALARALAGGPRLLLLDEPTRSLAPELAASVHEALARFADARGCAMVLATHSPAEASRLAHRALVLQEGVLDDAAV